MKASLLAGLLCAAAPSFAADNPANTPIPAPALSPEAAAESSIKELEVCLDSLEYFTNDLKKKDAELDKEFKGKVPSAFVFLMNMKRGRVSRQHEECSKIVKRGDKPLLAVEADIKSLAADGAEYKKTRKRLDDLRGRMNKSLRRFSALSQ